MTVATNPTIAVFGATGNQGGAVVNALLDRGASVRALVRNPDSEKAKAFETQGVELAYADVVDPASLLRALKDVDAFFYMTTLAEDLQGSMSSETVQGMALADAAVEAAVPHVVFSSVGGAERKSGVPHFESKRRVEEYLDGLDIPVTVIRPVLFMDNFAFMGPSLENGEIVVRLPMPDGIPLQMIAVRDIGRVAAAALLDTATISGGAIEIAGDERTGSQIAAAFGEYAGLEARYEALPIQVLDGQDDMQKMFTWFAETPAYQADLAATRAIVPDILDLPGWMRATGWAPCA